MTGNIDGFPHFRHDEPARAVGSQMPACFCPLYDDGSSTQGLGYLASLAEDTMGTTRRTAVFSPGEHVPGKACSCYNQVYSFFNCSGHDAFEFAGRDHYVYAYDSSWSQFSG